MNEAKLSKLGARTPTTMTLTMIARYNTKAQGTK